MSIRNVIGVHWKVPWMKNWTYIFNVKVFSAFGGWTCTRAVTYSLRVIYRLQRKFTVDINHDTDHHFWSKLRSCCHQIWCFVNRVINKDSKNKDSNSRIHWKKEVIITFDGCVFSVTSCSKILYKSNFIVLSFSGRRIRKSRALVATRPNNHDNRSKLMDIKSWPLVKKTFIHQDRPYQVEMLREVTAPSRDGFRQFNCSVTQRVVAWEGVKVNWGIILGGNTMQPKVTNGLKCP